MRKFIWFCLLLLFGLQGFGGEKAFFVTWTGDPAHTAVVRWFDGGELSFRIQGSSEWKPVKSLLVAEEEGVRVYSADLVDLQGDTRYELSFNSRDAVGFFKTLPEALNRPIRIVIGGDIYLEEGLFAKMNRQIRQRQPDMAILGGDLAYTEGGKGTFKSRAAKWHKWKLFIEELQAQTQTTEGRILPILFVVGNHDISKWEPKLAQQMFYKIAPMPEKEIAYRPFEVAGKLQFILLDSGHSAPIPGVQTFWLEKLLKEQHSFAYRIPVYHIAAFPTVESYKAKLPLQIREFWVPLFEKYGVKLAFEHHNHANKRTYPIWQGRVNQERGVVYLGDGSWGTRLRKTEKRWYLAKRNRANAVWLLTLSKEGLLAEAIDSKGQVLDAINF